MFWFCLFCFFFLKLTVTNILFLCWLLLKVTCILPSIPHDPEDNVSMEDKLDDDLDAIADLSKKRYRFTVEK